MMNPKTIALSAAGGVAALLLFVYILLPGWKPASGGGGEPGAAAGREVTMLWSWGPASEMRAAGNSKADDKIRELEARLAAAEAKGAGGTKPKPPFADPEMRKVMQAEADSGVKRGVAAMFEAGLGDELQLSPEQRKTFETLLTQRGLIVWDQIMIPMAAGELNRERMVVAGRSVRQSIEINNGEIRGLLGDEGFAQYERFAQAQPDRDTVKQLSPKFAEAGLELSAEQRAELLNVMAAQRGQFPLQDFGDPMKIDYGRFDETFSEEKTNQYFEERQRYHERVAEESRQTLSPEQATLLRNLLAAELQRAKFTVRTTRAMLGQTR